MSRWSLCIFEWPAVHVIQATVTLVLIGILVVMICGEAKAWIDLSILFLFVLRTLGQGWQTSLSVLFSLFLVWKSKRSRISDLIQFTENPIHIFLTYLFLAEVRDPQRNLQRNFMEFRKGLLPVLIALEMIYQPPTLHIRILEIKVALPF